MDVFVIIALLLMVFMGYITLYEAIQMKGWPRNTYKPFLASIGLLLFLLFTVHL